MTHDTKNRPSRSALLLSLGLMIALVPSLLPAQTDWARQIGDTARQIGVEAPTPNVEAPDFEGWPPSLGSEYPDLLLRGLTGEGFDLDSLLGKVVLLEFADMRSPESQSLAGAHLKGSLAGVEPNPNVHSLSEYVDPMLGGVGFGPDAIQRVIVLVADENGNIPGAATLQVWSEQFGLTSENGAFVVAPTRAMQGLGLDRLAPGFHLLNPEGELAATATGRNALIDLRRDIVPAIATMLGREPNATDRPTFTEQDIHEPGLVLPEAPQLPDPPRIETRFNAIGPPPSLEVPPVPTPTPQPRETLEDEARERLRGLF